MFKAILLFIKTHTIATTITTVVVVGGVTSAVVIPPMVEEYKLTKKVEPNLYMLVSSDYQAPSGEITEGNNAIEVNNTIIEENHQEVDKSTPLTFRMERIEEKNDNDKSVSYVIVPSYDKDFSQWSKEEKEAYQELFEEIASMAEQDYNLAAQKEQEALANVEAELEKIEASWSKVYYGGVMYNSYTKRVHRKSNSRYYSYNL